MSPETLLIAEIEARLAQPYSAPLVVGLCGAQGSGKSTVAAALARHFPRSACLSIDDLYLTRKARAGLSQTVHPLLATRGVPGTHEITLGQDIFAALDDGRPTALVRFDKATDDRSPSDLWPIVEPPCDLIIFEGWCVGARPQAQDALRSPVNALERARDADARWRGYVNERLGLEYQNLFARIDMLAMLVAPSWETIVEWRLDQEQKLRASGARGVGVMTDDQVRAFLSHYERLTRHMLIEMPQRCDIALHLRPDRTCRRVSRPTGK